MLTHISHSHPLWVEAHSVSTNQRSLNSVLQTLFSHPCTPVPHPGQCWVKPEKKKNPFSSRSPCFSLPHPLSAWILAQFICKRKKYKHPSFSFRHPTICFIFITYLFICFYLFILFCSL
ncbi:hypothetical protein VIGAN_03050100, partial [Vigna angularis var. angularis]